MEGSAPLVEILKAAKTTSFETSRDIMLETALLSRKQVLAQNKAALASTMAVLAELQEEIDRQMNSPLSASLRMKLVDMHEKIYDDATQHAEEKVASFFSMFQRKQPNPPHALPQTVQALEELRAMVLHSVQRDFSETYQKVSKIRELAHTIRPHDATDEDA